MRIAGSHGGAETRARDGAGDPISAEGLDLPPRRPPLSLPLADPARTFAAMALWLEPLRVLRHLILPLALLGGIAAAFNWTGFLAHLERATATLQFWQNLLLGMLTANLLSKIAQGVTMARHGLLSEEIGLHLAFGFIPRFYIDNRGIARLDFPTQRACYGAPLLSRLMLFAGGILAWAVLLRTGSGLADAGVVLAGVGFGSFLFTANPLWPADGYRWFAARLEQRRLRPNAMRLLGLVLRRRPIPPDLGRSMFWGLLLYALASLVFTALIAWLVLSGFAYLLEEQLRGTGVIIFCVLLAAVALFLVALRDRKRTGPRRRRPPRARGDAPRRSGGPDVPPRPAAARVRDRGPRIAEGDRIEAPGREDVMAERRQRSRTTRRPPALPPRMDEQGANEDALAALLEDASVWGDEAEAPARMDGPGAEVATAPDPSLDDILAMPPARGLAAPAGDLTADELEEVLSAALGPAASGDGEMDPDLAFGLGNMFDDVPLPGADAPDEPRREAAQADAGSPAAPPEPGPAAAAPRPEPSPVARHLPAKAAATMPAPVPKPRPVPPPQPARSAAMDDLDRLLKVGAARPARANRWRAAAVWAVLLGVLAWVAFLPYPFEVGGDFTVQPLDRAEVRSRTDGEITAVNVAEGDWVEPGQVMAVLSNWDEQRDVAVNEADGAALRAELDALTEGASPEEIAVAQREVDTAEVQVAATADELARQEALFANGNISEVVVEQARAAHAVAVSNRDEAAARLALVAAPTRATEITALQAAIQRNEDELAFARLMLENTNIRAPVAGQVVSSLAEVPVGAYLPSGGLFAELEDNRTVIAEVEVPEITIHEVEVGAPVELRLWSDADASLAGTVRSIAPRAEPRDFGNVVRVQVEVPNPDGQLAANMTGFGKVSAAERPVWQAFGRAIQRFFVIELWSWLP